MKQIGNHFLSEFLSKRTSLVEILLTTLFLALGINLISGSLPFLLHWSEQVALGIGVTLCLLSILYFIARFLSARRRTRTYSAFLTYNKRLNRIINIREYYFSRIIASDIDSLLANLSNTKTEWDRGTLEGAETDDNRGSIRILRESIEYFVLRELSIHLKRRFNKSTNTNIRTFYPHDMQNILESNRFMMLFTPLNSNIGREEEYHSRESPQVTRPASQDDKFVLPLPIGSKINKFNERTIEINTNKFKMIIEPIFNGVELEVPEGFHRYYLNLNRNDRVTDFSVGVKIDVVFKLSMFLSRSGFEYYQWLDSFLEALDLNMSERIFFDSIQWKSNYPVISYLDSLIKTSKIKSSDKPDDISPNSIAGTSMNNSIDGEDEFSVHPSEIGQASSVAVDPIRLRHILIEYFTEEELRDLAFDMAIDYETLPATGSAGKARELIKAAQHRGKFVNLREYVQELRPNAS